MQKMLIGERKENASGTRIDYGVVSRGMGMKWGDVSRVRGWCWNDRSMIRVE